jgi:hypothetical protein
MSAPKYFDGRYLKHLVTILIRLRVLIIAREGTVADGFVRLRREYGTLSHYYARRGWSPACRLALWIREHKWDLDEWCYARAGLMWLDDADYFRNCRWRFPWRRLPSLPGLLRGVETGKITLDRMNEIVAASKALRGTI